LTNFTGITSEPQSQLEALVKGRTYVPLELNMYQTHPTSSTTVNLKHHQL